MHGQVLHETAGWVEVVPDGPGIIVGQGIDAPEVIGLVVRIRTLDNGPGRGLSGNQTAGCQDEGQEEMEDLS